MAPTTALRSIAGSERGQARAQSDGREAASGIEHLAADRVGPKHIDLLAARLRRQRDSFHVPTSWSLTLFFSRALAPSATVRLVGPCCSSKNDEWAVQRRYMTLETLKAPGDDPQAKPRRIAAG